MKIIIWLKVAQTGPLGLVEKIILLSSGSECPRAVHFTLLESLQIKNKYYHDCDDIIIYDFDFDIGLVKIFK